MIKLNLSSLTKTWIFDIDGTLVKHNGHLTPNGDSLLNGVKEFFNEIPKEDMIILLTARKEEYRTSLINFLESNELRFDYLICNVPPGERILINDAKPSGLRTAYAINKNRDADLTIELEINPKL